MPDLIIKPTNTSGNKVIIQDQGAVTRLQTDDAGITITAPTIASMANCTFPAGHVIQTVHSVNTYEKQHSGTSETSHDSASGVAWVPEITPTATSSHILTFWNLSYKTWRSDEKDGRGNIALKYKIGDSGTEAYVPSSAGGGSWGDILGAYDYGADNAGIQLAGNYSFITKLSPSTTTKVVFLAYSSVGNAGAATVQNPGAAHSLILMMEIAG